MEISHRAGSESFQVTPLVLDGVMYLTNQKSRSSPCNRDREATVALYWQLNSPRAAAGATRTIGVAVARERSFWQPRMPTRRPGC
jgi:hypothetical protein